MARTPVKTGISYLRRAPWAVVLRVGMQIAQELGRRWASLSPYEQQELLRLLKISRGRPGNLTARERAELRRIVVKAAKYGR